MPTIFMEKVTIGDLTFNDRLSFPEEAQHFSVDMMPGWDETPEMDVYLAQQGGADGEVFGDNATLRARHLTIGGYVLAPDRATAKRLFDSLVRDAFPRNKTMTLTRYEADEPKLLFVRREGTVEPMWPVPNGFRFTVLLVAADPFKYALTESTGTAGVSGSAEAGWASPLTFPLVFTAMSSDAGSLAEKVVVENRGSSYTLPVVTLTGPLPRGTWSIGNETNNGTLRYDVGLSTGDVMIIDFKAQTATLNGSLVAANITGDFWRIDPGVNVVRLYAEYNPDATITVFARSAWE